MTKQPVIPGVWWVEIPHADLRILCGTPADIMKHLFIQGFIRPIESNGITFETGPNAILLSDKRIQNGHFWNLAEFPFLHMLFRQGMGIPKHPANTGRKPIIAGHPQRCNGIIDYLVRGTYGLLDREEMLKSGVPKKDLEDLMRLKLKFAGGEIKSSSELIDLLPIDKTKVQIVPGVSIQRTAENVYVLESRKERLEIDMNLPESEDWQAPYELKAIDLHDNGFAVTHIGEGNGWNPKKLCMGSMITLRGRRYLIDAGPGVSLALEKLGVDKLEIDGLFLTHVHDDHFASLASILLGDKIMKVYATEPVMATARFKCEALMEESGGYFDRIVEPRVLKEDTWNDIDGLEVRPTVSPHPLETTIMFFRSSEGGVERSYAHLADIVSYQVLEGFVGGADGISRTFADRIRHEYSRKADIKKIDAGRGLIHGFAEDFADDESPRRILSHMEEELSDEEKAIGIGVNFGDVDILIPHDESEILRKLAEENVRRMFPSGDVSQEDLDGFLSGEIKRFPPAWRLIAPGRLPGSMYLVLRGTIDFTSERFLTSLRFIVGSFVGEREFLLETNPDGVYTTRGYATVMELSPNLYNALLKSSGRRRLRRDIILKRDLLIETGFFGKLVGCSRLDDLAHASSERVYTAGSVIEAGEDEVYIILEGQSDKPRPLLFPGERWKVLRRIRAFVVPWELIRTMPILWWDKGIGSSDN